MPQARAARSAVETVPDGETMYRYTRTRDADAFRVSVDAQGAYSVDILTGTVTPGRGAVDTTAVRSALPAVQSFSGGTHTVGTDDIEKVGVVAVTNDSGGAQEIAIEISTHGVDAPGGPTSFLQGGGSTGSVVVDGQSQRYDESINVASIVDANSGTSYDVGNDLGSVDGKDINPSSVNTDELSAVFTHRVSSAGGLETLDADISTGEVVHVAQPDTPYRTSAWLDIDTDEVDIVFESRWAGNGEPIVRAADGSSTGGIRIGNNTATAYVTVTNFGWGGNRANVSSDDVARHGVHILDASNIKVNDSYVVNTAPNRLDGDYSTQAQGFYADTQSRFVQFNSCFAEDAGYDGFSTTGKRIEVNDCRSFVNINRGLSTVGHENTNQGSFITVNGGVFTGGEFPASAIGVGFDGTGGNVTINGPLLRGGLVSDQHGVTVRKGASNVTVNGAIADGFSGQGFTVENQRGPTEDVTFNGCVATDCTRAVWVKGGTNVTINGGTFKNQTTNNYPFIIDASGTDIHNVTIESFGKAGITVDADGIKCAHNTIKNFGPRGGFFLQSGTGVQLTNNTGVPESTSSEWFKWDGDCRPVLKDNVLDGDAVAYSASNSTHLPAAAVNNDPGYVYSTAPTAPINYHPYIAGTGWDPDSDSEAELVMTDDGGSTWQEIVALPNT